MTRSTGEAFNAQCPRLPSNTMAPPWTCWRTSPPTFSRHGPAGRRRFDHDVGLQKTFRRDLRMGVGRQERPGGEPDEGRDLEPT